MNDEFLVENQEARAFVFRHSYQVQDLGRQRMGPRGSRHGLVRAGSWMRTSVVVAP